MRRSSLSALPALHPSPSPDRDLTGEPRAPSARRLRIMFGTLVAIETTASSETAALAAIELAFDALGAVDRLMHPSRAGSDLARINGARSGEAVPLDRSTWSVLQLAQRVHAASGGTFDPCLPVRPGQLPDLELSEAADGQTCWARCHRPLCLDLGGIAKGYAIDRAIRTLRRARCQAGLVNAGGDLRVFGAWAETILLRHADGRCEPRLLKNAALAVSDRESGRHPSEHRGYYRRSGRAVRRPHAAVLAPEAAVADALTKCVLLGARAQAAHALREFGAMELTGVLDRADSEPHLRALSDSRSLP